LKTLSVQLNINSNLKSSHYWITRFSNKRNSRMSMTEAQQQKILQEWRASAPYWERYASTFRAMFAPVTNALIEDAGIVRGQSILDVAGGAGEPSLTIAETVGPTGSVTYTDAVAEMVGAAQSEAHKRGITNISFRQCSGDSLPFEGSSFDAAVCRLGVMFFPDPLAALRGMLRVTKPNGALALVVWHKSELNPFLHLVTDVLSRYVETPPTAPDAPGAFRFAEPGVLAHILRKAGAGNVRERVLKFQMEAPISIDEFWELRSQTSGTLREKLSTLSDKQVMSIAQDVKNAVGEFFRGGHMSFPAQMIIVIGGKQQNHD
jgi:ubiquinone/menaquinone biosynthesis C-methylase UbiE